MAEAYREGVRGYECESGFRYRGMIERMLMDRPI
jgi:hypothetical protein